MKSLIRTIRTDKICKIYNGRKVVNNVSISVSQGEIVGLLGPNGAGKTTSFYMIVGMVRPDAGRGSQGPSRRGSLHWPCLTDEDPQLEISPLLYT